MSIPAFKVEVAFASLPFANPQVYTVISTYARTATVNYGRRSEEETPGTGASTTVLKNNDRRFDPVYAAGPYYPNVVPERRIRCIATLDAVDYPLFVHYIDGWPQPYELARVVNVPVQATDGMEILAQAELPPDTAYAEELSGTRITNILDSIGWPAAERAIDVGKSRVIAAVAGSLDGSQALNLIQDVAQTELGLAFIAPDGTFTFHDRHRRLVSPYTVSQATFTDAGGGLNYHGLVTNYDRAQIKNDWRITRSGGVEQVSEDATSILAYRRRTRRKSTLHTSDSEALTQAQFLVSRYKDPHLRFEALTIKPGRTSTLWAQCLNRKLGDRITVIRNPPGGGTAITQQAVIEGISHSFTTDIVSSETTWQLSPADVDNYWLAGVAGFSEAGTTTRAVY